MVHLIGGATSMVLSSQTAYMKAQQMKRGSEQSLGKGREGITTFSPLSQRLWGVDKLVLSKERVQLGSSHGQYNVVQPPSKPWHVRLSQSCGVEPLQHGRDGCEHPDAAVMVVRLYGVHLADGCS